MEDTDVVELNVCLRMFLRKYSLDEILKLCTVCSSNRSLDIMDPVLLQELATHVGLDTNRLRDMYIDTMNDAPALLDLNSPTDSRSIVVITSPVTSCTEGCVYQRGHKTGLPLELEHHNKPAWGKLHDINGISRSFVRLSRRCPVCRSIYKYDMFQSKKDGQYRFYEQERPYVRVTHTTYWTRTLCKFLVENVLHCKASFNGFCETSLETYGKAAGSIVDRSLCARDMRYTGSRILPGRRGRYC
ncbi:uncharacterized protein LOC129588978 [Paramacrobiotus metropolitanus]|uniref:uncharacterized protein LOC129588978 n=1 Tax=Paramacrobiotus metropolitanus TaxID=2943436 RepID=UPI002445721B|nr:uncharacterized protein LOC129588978 [Paramacrobiotus metropolitanus]